MTPCEQLGYAVGDVFRYKGGSGTFTYGSIIMLEADDGSDCPICALVEGYTIFRLSKLRSDRMGACAVIDNLVKLEEE